MLLLRLRTLAPYVDKHYIGFSTLSFSHKATVALSFAPFDAEIRSFSHRWFWFNYTSPPEIAGAWAREADSHHALLSKLEEVETLRMDDLVIWSDVDEIVLPSGLSWVRQNPPAHFYRFLGHLYFYSYRWRSPDVWQWAYVMRYGSKLPEKTWVQYRIPDFPPFEYVPGISLQHCTYCFPKLRMIIEKLQSFSHGEYSKRHYVDPNHIYAKAYCGDSMFGGAYTLVSFDPMGINVPNDTRFDFLKKRVGFDDLAHFEFDRVKLKQYASCRLPFLADGQLPRHLPHHLD